jgi:hypothetical protein
MNRTTGFVGAGNVGRRDFAPEQISASAPAQTCSDDDHRHRRSPRPARRG